MSDDGVTDVLGSLLLVSITISLMIGLSLTVLSMPGPPDRVLADLSIDASPGQGGWGSGDEVLRIRHLGGEPVEGQTEILLRLDGTSSRITADDQGFADGVFSIGETWETTLTLATGQSLDVGILHQQSQSLLSVGDLVAGGGSSGGGTPPPSGTIDNMPAVTMVTGSIAGQANLGADDGVDAVLSEATLGSPTTVRLYPGAVSTDQSVVQEDRALTSNNQRARMNDANDLLGVNGFDVPGAALGISQVVIGIEAQYDGLFTTDARLWYRIGGIDGATDLTETFDAGDDTFTVDVTADRAWTIADVESMEVRVQRETGEFELEVDVLFVDVTYTDASGGALEAILDFTNVPAGSPTLELEATPTGDGFAVEVWDWVAGTYHARGGPLTGAWSYSINGDEHDVGNTAIRIRIVDDDGGVGPGQVALDYARVVVP